MSEVSNFDVLKRMATEDKSIMLCPDVLNMNYSEKTKGTKVVVGVPGNPILDIMNGRKCAVLLIWDNSEFNAIKAAIVQESAAAPVTETPTQIATELGASMHRERYSL